MKRATAAALVLLAGVSPAALAGDKKKEDDPLPRKEAILKRFAEEFVQLTPGQGKYPASVVIGSEKGPDSEQPARRVNFTRPFAVGKYEVTQELYHVIMGKNPSKWKGPRNSVEMITWQEANEFCTRVTEELRKRKLIAADERIRLPSEAEWEYACRAGTTTAWSFGDKVEQIGEYAWFKVNAPGNDPPVGQKKPNPWGLYDMHGYVSEWCLDPWHGSYEGAPADAAPRQGEARDYVIRGGSFADEAEVQRSAARQRAPAETRSDKIGFRCVKEKAAP